MSTKKIILGAALTLMVSSAAFLWWHFSRKITLVDLQKRYLFAETDEEKAEIVRQLEEYYLTLDIPDSISQKVAQEVQVLLDTTKIDLADYSDDLLNESNPYVLENKLHRDLIKMAMIARAQGEEQVFRQLMAQARKAAKIVDEKTENDYWVGFVEEVNSYGQEQAFTWLEIFKFDILCSTYHDDANKWRLAEFVGASALKKLEKNNDLRLKLNVIQRLQYILYEYYQFNALSVAFSQNYIGLARAINYRLRESGIEFYIADALFKSGAVTQAKGKFRQVINISQKFHQVPYISIYRNYGLLRQAEIHRLLGEFDEATAICDSLERWDLTGKSQIVLNINRGLIQRSIGNYENAEAQYLAAMEIAEKSGDIKNTISILNNLGELYKELTEYDIALDYYHKSNLQIEKFNLEKYLKIKLKLNIAEILAVTERFTEFENTIKEIESLIDLVELPARKAQYLFTTGKINLRINRFPQALSYLERAHTIYSDNGLVGKELETESQIIECLLGLHDVPNAKKRIEKFYRLASKMKDPDRIIDAIALKAEIKKLEGKITDTIKISNQLLTEIEKNSIRIKDKSKLVLYRQKMYDYMKNSVLYEIQNNRIDSAFVKLDYAKARSLKKSYLYNDSPTNGKLSESALVDIDSLKKHLAPESFLIDYFIAQDTIYVFVLNNETLELFRKKTDLDILEKEVYAYKKSIKETITIFNNYNPKLAESHFMKTATRSHQLYKKILGWHKLESSLEKATLLYIVPDEFLYEVPFATLVTDTAKTQSYLVSRTAIINLPGASCLPRHSIQNLRWEDQKVLLSVDTSFPEAKKFQKLVKDWLPNFEELASSNKPITKEAVLNQLNKQKDIYIFLGHGAANPKNPELSFIELTVKNPFETAPVTVKLSMSDLKMRDWHASQLVLLIGCETVGQKLYRGTGISGLQLGFMSLGAKNVIANMWSVDAKQVIPQTLDMLQILIKTGNPALALQKSQLNAIRKLQNNESFNNPHPYFWGSYLLTEAN